jgi:hypothetical protein
MQNAERKEQKGRKKNLREKRERERERERERAQGLTCENKSKKRVQLTRKKKRRENKILAVVFIFLSYSSFNSQPTFTNKRHHSLSASHQLLLSTSLLHAVLLYPPRTTAFVRVNKVLNIFF